jgi:hypothetical protein
VIPEIDLWYEYLNASSFGIVSMYSCKIGQAAGEFPPEDTDSGGFYTTFMIRSAKHWEVNAESNTCFTTKDAHDKTIEYMQKRHFQQQPQYSPSNLTFPFAVKA